MLSEYENRCFYNYLTENLEFERFGAHTHARTLPSTQTPTRMRTQPDRGLYLSNLLHWNPSRFALQLIPYVIRVFTLQYNSNRDGRHNLSIFYLQHSKAKGSKLKVCLKSLFITCKSVFDSKFQA